MKRRIYQNLCDCGRPATHRVGTDAECCRCRELRIAWNKITEREVWLEKQARKHYEALQAHEDAA